MNDVDAPNRSVAQQAVTLPKLLSDKPEKQDSFGAHSAIARTLASLILSDSEGRCVALQGSWGSGKSTVIGMLEAALASKADVFMFDTWSNQGDPLRFSFMGEFASWVGREFPELEISAREWRQDIEDTARRATREERGPHKLKPKQAKTVAASLIVGLPVGLALASDQWAKLLPDAIATGLYFVGLTLVVSPFLYLAYLWKTKKLDFFQEVVEAIEKAADETKRIVVRRGPLATSLEFNRKIQVFCSALHNVDRDRKLLIIFDNIDRVAERNSAKVWSLLTALLEAVHDKDADFAKNIWVLVPVDLDSVPVPVSVVRRGSKKGAAPSADDLKLEFIEKTFQLNMVVPPPLSVAIERYFQKQYERAFGGTPVAGDWYECYSVLREIRGIGQAFTPRAIKRFINDLVGLWRSRHEFDKADVPSIALMTLYLCQRDRINHPDDVLHDIVTPSITPHLSDKDPIASLAALAFGGKVSDGLQILVRAQVDAAVENGDVSVFDGLKDADGFAEAVASYIKSIGGTWLNNDVSLLARSYEVVGHLDSKLQQAISAKLSPLTRSLLSKPFISGKIDGHVAMGLAQAVYFHGGDIPKQAESTLSVLLGTVAGSQAGNADAGPNWFTCADLYLKELKSRNVSLDGLKIKLPVQDALALQVLQSDVRRLLAIGKVTFVIADNVLKHVTQTLAEEAAAFTLNNNSLVVTFSLRQIAPGFNTAAACRGMAARFQNANGVTAEQYGAVLTFLDDGVTHTSDAALQSEVRGWIQTGFLHHHYQTAQGDRPSIAPRLLSLVAALKVPVNEVRGWNQSPAGMQNFQAECNALKGAALTTAFNYLIGRGHFHSVIRQASALGLNPLREGLLRLVVTQRPDLYKADTYCAEISEIMEALSDDLRNTLTRYAIDVLKVDEFLAKRETAEPHLGYMGYQRIGNAITDATRQKAFFMRVGQLLSADSLEWWTNTVRGNDQILLGLVNTITDLLQSGWLNGEAARRVTGDWTHSREFMSDQARKTYTIALLHALNPADRSMILAQVANKAIAQLGDLTEFGRVRDLAEFLFADAGVLAEINKITLNVLIPAIEHDPQGRAEAAALVEKYGLTDKATGDARKRLAEALAPPKEPETPNA